MSKVAYESIEVWSLALAEARRDEWSPPHIFAEGAAWGAGWMAAIIGAFEALRKTAPHVKRCASCGYDPERDGDHPDDAYDNTIYTCEGGLFCGPCADQLGECDAE